MANQSGKRQQKRLQSALPLYLCLAVALTAAKGAGVALQALQGTLAARDWALLLGHGGVNLLAYRSIAQALECGLAYGRSLDLFAAANTLLLLGLFSYKAYYLLCALPLYLLYLLGRRVWAFAGKDYAAEQLPAPSGPRRERRAAAQRAPLS